MMIYMGIFIMALYLLKANFFVVPLAVWIVSWTLFALATINDFISANTITIVREDEE